MGIKRADTIAVVDDHGLAITAIPTGEDDPPRVCSPNGGTMAGGKIYTGMEAAVPQNRMDAVAKAARDAAIGWEHKPSGAPHNAGGRGDFFGESGYPAVQIPVPVGLQRPLGHSAALSGGQSSSSSCWASSSYSFFLRQQLLLKQGHLVALILLPLPYAAQSLQPWPSGLAVRLYRRHKPV